MKKFTKLFLSCAAVAVISAAIGASAMAADAIRSTDGISGSYDAGTLTVTAPTALTSAQKTIIVLAPADGETAASWQALSADDIIGIDQKDAITEVKLDPAKVDTANKTYIVAMGGDGEVYFGEFGKQAETPAGTKILIGDADSSGDIDADDSVAILKYNVGKFALDTPAKLAAADSDRSGEVDADDSVAILKFNVGKISAANGNENVGEEIEVDLSVYTD